MCHGLWRKPATHGTKVLAVSGREACVRGLIVSHLHRGKRREPGIGLHPPPPPPLSLAGGSETI